MGGAEVFAEMPQGAEEAVGLVFAMDELAHGRAFQADESVAVFKRAGGAAHEDGDKGGIAGGGVGQAKLESDVGAVEEHDFAESGSFYFGDFERGREIEGEGVFGEDTAGEADNDAETDEAEESLIDSGAFAEGEAIPGGEESTGMEGGNESADVRDAHINLLGRYAIWGLQEVSEIPGYFL